MRRLPCTEFVVALGCAAIASGLAAQDITSLAPGYTGPGSCASPSCHGSIQPRNQTSVLQNEYSTWVVKDKHAKAFAVLTNPIGARMGRILGLAHPETAQKCLACHALDVPVNQQAQTFYYSDGVSCENCHGPASNWLGPHTTRNWSYDKSLGLGMYNTRDLIKRSEKCLSCHVGNSEKLVDHEMIAAGHPDLYFELDSFQAVMPKHWKYRPDGDRWIGVRTLAVGEAVQLRESLQRLISRARGGVWPEYSELDCYACHHSLTAASDSWRQERGYPDRKPGNPSYNLSRFIVFRKVVEEVYPSAALQLDSQMNRIYKILSSPASDRNQVLAPARDASSTANGIAQRLINVRFNRDLALRLMKSISADADAISGQGERSAEQAAMALQSTFVACSDRSDSADAEQCSFKDAENLRTAISRLFKQFENPSSYNSNLFAQQMRVVNALL